jgi:crotonobetainyl-CoA:carnitine CoA-transferase CaiB-like acyl-CoA transferase
MEVMRLFALDCYPEKDGKPTVVMIVTAETEAAAIRLAFDHPNAANYQAIALNPKQKIRRADGLSAGIQGFIEWRAFKTLIGKA